MPGRRTPRPPREPPDAAGALEIALHFLGTRPRTRWELERRLQATGVSQMVLDGVLARLAELGYLDDEAFARYWAEQRDRHAPRGRRMVEAELRQRGVPRDVIERLRSEPADRQPEDDALPETEAQRARIALERHLHGRPVPEDQKALQRIGMFLMRRGFDPETVRGVLRHAGADSVDDTP
ncbi:MAG: recombination regulator RecX [Chloroflexota bacterium]|nr:recombination regulator RecX [Chloroflexota bacterium]